MEFHYLSDQPFTCPKCGSRTDYEGKGKYHRYLFTIEFCLNPNCGSYYYVFNKNYQ